jgi:AcrR family transcriptional regulator
MTKARDQDRFAQLVGAATRLFIEQGYRRTQIEDIAHAMGLAKGTVYLYVASKEALFDLVLRCADRDPVTPKTLPVPTPQAEATFEVVRSALAERARFPLLFEALGRENAGRVREELEGILGELYDVMFSNRTGLKLIDRCAQDFPELAALWRKGGREGLLGLLGSYLERRREHLRPFGEPAIAARIVIEMTVLWAVHRHWDPWPQEMDESLCRRMVIETLLHGLIPDTAR